MQSCDGARRIVQRRRDLIPNQDQDAPAPSAESLQALAEVMGAAGFEAYTEGKALVKRLIPANSQPDLDVVEHQGVIGRAGVDFPAFPTIPNTGFNCKNVPTGYYADLETDCQVFHICDTSRKISFLCPNGTIFSQSHLICDWWFKVDCASAPALYESSAEYYSNEQKKSQRGNQSPTRNPDLQQLGDTNVRTESKQIPSTTERLLRQHQRLHSEGAANTVNVKTPRSFQTLYPEINSDPTQKTQATTMFEKRRKNLVQLIANNFGNLPKRTTLPAFEYSTRRPTPARDFVGIREMQVAAETASFAQNQNRQFLTQDYSKTYRPFPVYTPNLSNGSDKTKTNPTLTTLYDFRDKYLPQSSEEATTKRASLMSYTKSYTETIEKQEPYTRPGISSLKEFLAKEKSKATSATTEMSEITETSTKTNKRNSNTEEKKLTIETKSSFEAVTVKPEVTQEDSDYIETSSSDRIHSHTNKNQRETTESSYQERRERLISKLNLEAFGPTEPTFTASLTEKYYGNLPNRPGLIVPPSLTPKTLHSLAIYYATGLDNFATTTTPEEVEGTTLSFDEYEAMEEGLPALFSQQTVNKYSNLFGNENKNAQLLEDIKLDPNGTYNELAEDLSTQMSQNPLAASPQIRELAQVFTHALSAYLQDPVQFRKVLSDIRPTPPNFGDMLTTDELLYNTEPTTTVNEDDQEILGFSDDHKVRVPIVSLREGKSLKTNLETKDSNDLTTTTTVPTTTEIVTSPSTTTTIRTPFRCCGRISASYTTAAQPKEPSSTPNPFTHTGAAQVNSLSNKFSENVISTTENNYSLQKYGGFQNNLNVLNSTQYGKDVNAGDFKPFNDYTEITNLPSAWGVDATLMPVTNGNIFESKRIKSTIPETTPVYFTETENIELENEEELQRAHSQSFVTPQGNSVRQGKNINLDDSKNNFKRPSENLEAPTTTTMVDTSTAQTTTDLPTTTVKDQTESLPTTAAFSGNIFTSPDSDRTTYQFPTTFENWQNTIVVDPITLNDGLSSTGSDQKGIDLVEQSNSWSLTTSTAAPTEYAETSETTVSSTVAIQLSALSGRAQERYGRLLKDSTTESPQESTTIADTVVEKAKEIMGGMNSTTTEKLMNVMMKTKSKTVKRLILLLIQTCDDDHNSTAEASKKALLEALMAVSQRDMEEVAKEQEATELPSTTASYDYFKTTLFSRRMDSQPLGVESTRRGKSLQFDASAINSLSHSATTESVTTEQNEATTLSPTTESSQRAEKIVVTKTATDDSPKLPAVNWPLAQARVAPQSANPKGSSDTRALELLRSLYTIAARWG
ncbi:unnamed protein product, partial [Iphiclides podalirius]